MMRILLISLILGCYYNAQAQSPTFFDSLYRLSFDHIEITVDIDSLLEFKLTPIEHPSVLKVVAADSVLLELPLKVSVRSKSRRRYCDFPPIKLNFVKGQLEEIGLDRDDEFKIVTHCLKSKSGELGLKKEKLIYDLYSIITPISLRSKLFEIVYVDKNSGKKTLTQSHFVGK